MQGVKVLYFCFDGWVVCKEALSSCAVQVHSMIAGVNVTVKPVPSMYFQILVTL